MKKGRWSEKEIALIRRCQENIPLTQDPFGDIARELEVDEEWVYDTLRCWRKRNILRRFTAILYHQNAGYTANGMSVWEVPESRIEEVGQKMATFSEVSHCYHRPPLPDWTYNLYAMLHGKSKVEVEQIAAKISREVGIDKYVILFSVQEFKKSSMKYFMPEIEDNGSSFEKKEEDET